MDVRPGGVWRFVMHGPDGTDYQNRITYREVAKPERLVYAHGGGDDVEPVSFEVTVTFADRGGKTEVTVRMLFPTAEARNETAEKYGAVEGLTQTLERLGDEAAASGPGVFVVSRTFDAPRELVFKAWTEAERLAQWWGPAGMAVRVHSLDLRPGGVFHYSMKSPQGQMWGKFVYRDIVPPSRLVFVVSFADAAGNVVRAPFSAEWPLEVLSTLTLEERDGKTTITMRGVPINATEAERKTFEAGHGSMKQGWGGTLDQLAAFLAKK